MFFFETDCKTFFVAVINVSSLQLKIFCLQLSFLQTGRRKRFLYKVCFNGKSLKIYDWMDKVLHYNCKGFRHESEGYMALETYVSFHNNYRLKSIFATPIVCNIVCKIDTPYCKSLQFALLMFTGNHLKHIYLRNIVTIWTFATIAIKISPRVIPKMISKMFLKSFHQVSIMCFHVAVAAAAVYLLSLDTTQFNYILHVSYYYFHNHHLYNAT